MSKAGRRILQGTREMLAYVRGEAQVRLPCGERIAASAYIERIKEQLHNGHISAHGAAVALGMAGLGPEAAQDIIAQALADQRAYAEWLADRGESF